MGTPEKCFLCGRSTEFIAHAHDLCLSCGDNLQNLDWAAEVVRRYHNSCVGLRDLFLAAKDFIDKHPADPDISAEQTEAWLKYQDLLASSEYAP